tara:strand:- start:2050 stop:4179 length:2130 start_codon:yes stop_codon:yes gene_type:complete
MVCRESKKGILMPFFSGKGILCYGILMFKTLVLVAVTFLVSSLSVASDFGTTGLINIPTARMSSDGTFATTMAIQSRTNAYAISYQATPWLEGTFRYTGFNEFFHYDRNYEAKVRLWKEQDYLPQVAVGIRDLVGTAVWGAEYLVASKEVGLFDFTVGIGWGRLAGNGDVANPLIKLNDAFEVRPNWEGKGGELSTNTFFSGGKVGFFGGISHQFESLPVKFLIEYNPDQYRWEQSKGGLSPKSPISAAIEWQASPNLSISLSRQHDQEWGIALSASLDSKALPSKPSPKLFRSSLDYTADELPAGLNKNSWYDTLLFDVERSGLLLLESTVDVPTRTATLVMGNTGFPVWADAIASMARLADLHLPTTVNTFNIVIEEEGYRVHSVRMRRPSLTYGRNRQIVEREIRIEPARSQAYIQHKTSFVTKKIVFDVNLGTRTQLFDPDDPLRYQLYGNVEMSMALPKGLSLRGSYGVNITNNFDESLRTNSGSVLPRVRSDVVKYLVQGDTGLDSLYLEKRGNLRNDVYYRAFAGVLEEMYSGVGGEVLLQPFQSRLAYGLSANVVRKRDYDKSFKHLDYQTTTAFASVYWATPYSNFDVAIHAGRYLAKDVGATLEVRRTFTNGWMVGLWATNTNVSAEDFGEGSFDKGMFIKIPLGRLFGNSTRASFGNRIRPIQRDGGQRLESHSGSIWWDTRSARYDAFSELTERMLP